ncbi:hypothetical protein LCGC14_2936880, partial [marine sediment metagenome]
MTRFVYAADLHLRIKKPQHRIDEWPAVCLDKLEQIVRIAEEADAKFILCGGDV